jgi:hypothetical protein
MHFPLIEQSFKQVFILQSTPVLFAVQRHFPLTHKPKGALQSLGHLRFSQATPSKEASQMHLLSLQIPCCLSELHISGQNDLEQSSPANPGLHTQVLFLSQIPFPEQLLLQPLISQLTPE